MSNINEVGNSTTQETGFFFTPTTKKLIIRNYTGIGTHDKEWVLGPYWSFLLAGRYYCSTGTQVLLCSSTCFVFQGTMLFAASYSYLRAAPGLMGRAQGRSSLPQSFSEECSNVWGEVREARSPSTPSVPRRMSAKKYLVLHTTWYLIYEYQVLLLCTCFVSQRATFFRPSPRTGTFSALGWDRLPSTVA